MSKYARIIDIEKLLYRKGFCIGKTSDELHEALSELPTIEVSEGAISREWLIKRWDKMSVRGRTEFDQEIMVAPSVIPKAKEGEWVKVDDSVQPICSKCGMSCSGIHRNADYSVKPNWNYCPNCGAKMKGADDEQGVAVGIRDRDMNVLIKTD